MTPKPQPFCLWRTAYFTEKEVDVNWWLVSEFHQIKWNLRKVKKERKGKERKGKEGKERKRKKERKVIANP